MNLFNFNQFIKNEKSYSQLNQDLLALYVHDKKTNGFFVEFGACDGIELSNTYLLEKDYGWNGILAEPANVYHEQLENNRNCLIEKKCVYSKTNEKILFQECDLAMLSTVNDYKNNGDWATEERNNGRSYFVDTTTLDDLLVEHNSPQSIDYVSIDVEGSEYEILNSFSFNWDVKLFTIEHNFTPNRNKIYELMKKNNYERIFQEISEWDDWYIKR
jgi:FkbM family methyltransferase